VVLAPASPARNVNSLPKSAIEEDHRLERAENAIARALLQHRWHWTLDDSNPERVSQRQYAAAVDRSQNAIRIDATAYTLMGDKPGLSPSEARALAQVAEGKRAAVEAVAAANGVSIRHVREHLMNEVTVVLMQAGEQAAVEERPLADFLLDGPEAWQSRLSTFHPVDPPAFAGDYADAGAAMEARTAAADRTSKMMRDVLLVMPPAAYMQFLADVRLLQNEFHLRTVVETVVRAVHETAVQQRDQHRR
jgi:hypothetical protein